MYKENWLDKLQRKFRRFGVPNLMMYIVGGMAVVFLMDTIAFPMSSFSLTGALAFDREAIFSGQLWRIITFVLIPPNASPIFIVFSLYFYWLIGSTLENQWGTFRFNAFYFCGVICTMIAGLITGFATNYYLNMTLFLAFAIIYPNFQMLLFFCIPIKIKFLALVDVLVLAVSFYYAGWSGRIALFVAIFNIILFFWGDFIGSIKAYKRRREWQKKWNGVKSNWKK